MEKQEYALQAMELAHENHISINWFHSIWWDFFEQLWKLVYDMASHRRKLDIYSFWENSTMKIPWKTSFIEVNIS